MTGNPYTSSPKPYLEYWQKEGVNYTERRRDSEDCGAISPSSRDKPDGYPVFSHNHYQAMERPGEEKIITEKRLRALWQRCMLAKGYSDSEEWMLLIDKF
jgi:hypothetical protein